MSRLSVAVAHSVQLFNQLAQRLLNVLLMPPQPDAGRDLSMEQSGSSPSLSPTPSIYHGHEGSVPRRLGLFQNIEKESHANLLHIDVLSLAVSPLFERRKRRWNWR